jgi:hypothetical protein
MLSSNRLKHFFGFIHRQAEIIMKNRKYFYNPQTIGSNYDILTKLRFWHQDLFLLETYKFVQSLSPSEIPQVRADFQAVEQELIQQIDHIRSIVEYETISLIEKFSISIFHVQITEH